MLSSQYHHRGEIAISASAPWEQKFVLLGRTFERSFTSLKTENIILSFCSKPEKMSLNWFDLTDAEKNTKLSWSWSGCCVILSGSGQISLDLDLDLYSLNASGFDVECKISKISNDTCTSVLCVLWSSQDKRSVGQCIIRVYKHKYCTLASDEMLLILLSTKLHNSKPCVKSTFTTIAHHRELQDKLAVEINIHYCFPHTP